MAAFLLAFSAAVPAQQLGTLFHTPKEREALERLRRGESPGAFVAARPDPVITGYVKRSDGKSTVFIDKQPYAVRDGRIQGRLEPRIVERYEPIELAPPTADAGEAPKPGEKSAEKPAPSASAKPAKKE